MRVHEHVRHWAWCPDLRDDLGVVRRGSERSHFQLEFVDGAGGPSARRWRTAGGRGCDRRWRVHVHGVSGSLSSPSSSPVVLAVAMLAGGLGEAARASSAMGARVDACAGAARASLFRVIKPCRLSRFCAFCAGPLSNPPLLAAASPPAKEVLCTEPPGIEPGVEPVSLLSTPPI